MNSKTKKIIIYGSLIVIITLVFIIKIFPVNTGKSEKEPKKQAMIPVIDYIIAEGKNFGDTYKTNGTILSNEEAELRSEISGKIVKIYFKEGSAVKKGEILIKLNDAELQAIQRKNLSKLDLINSKEKRQKILLEKNGISQEEYEITLNEKKSVESDIDYTKAQIEKTEIVAPFNGIIGLRYVSEGSFITNATKLASVQSINPVKLDFSIPQRFSSMMYKGKDVSFLFRGKIYNAKVLAVEPKIDLSTRTLMVRAICPNTKQELQPGSYVEVDIGLGKSEDRITLPTEIIVPDAKGETVFLYENGKAVQKIIKTGVRNEKEVEIISGINAGDTIIASAIIQLRNGANVKLGREKQN